MWKVNAKKGVLLNLVVHVYSGISDYFYIIGAGTFIFRLQMMVRVHSEMAKASFPVMYRGELLLCMLLKLFLENQLVFSSCAPSPSLGLVLPPYNEYYLRADLSDEMLQLQCEYDTHVLILSCLLSVSTWLWVELLWHFKVQSVYIQEKDFLNYWYWYVMIYWYVGMHRKKTKGSTSFFSSFKQHKLWRYITKYFSIC